MNKLFLLFGIFLSLQLFGQQNRYWIKFKDKNENTYSLTNPQQFLSQQSIERRAKQNISLDITDLPLTQKYIDSVSPYITTLIHRLKWFNLIVVEIDDAANLNLIKQFPFVDTVAEIYFNPQRSAFGRDKFEDVFTPVNQSIVYPNKYGIAYRQINMLNADLLHQLGFRGEGITISMMDNGFLNADSNLFFDSVRTRILGTWDFVNNEADVYNDGAHGTNTFSCIGANIPDKFIGTAPDANFYLLTTEDNSAEWIMEEYNWVAGAEFADSAGAQIFSTSLGYTKFDSIGNHTYSDLTGDKTVITHAGNMAFAKGILVFNSAGNEGNKAWYHISAPADGDSIIAVGAVDSSEAIADFSGRGPSFSGRIKPDLCAQGKRSAIVNTGGSLGFSDGTSFSCPILAGCAATLWSAFPDKTARDIRDVIMMSADRFSSPDNNYGYGIPNFYNAYLLLKTNYNDKILKLSDDVTVFPNPFSDELNISVYGNEAGAHKIELFDLQGRKVYSKDFYLREGTLNLFTDEELQTLRAGGYILRYDGKKKYSHKLVKIK